MTNSDIYDSAPSLYGAYLLINDMIIFNTVEDLL